MKYIQAIAAIFIVIVLTYLSWAMSRQVNYYLSYESLVLDTVCKTVKPEYLNHECDGRK